MKLRRAQTALPSTSNHSVPSTTLHREATLRTSRDISERCQADKRVSLARTLWS